MKDRGVKTKLLGDIAMSVSLSECECEYSGLGLGLRCFFLGMMMNSALRIDRES